MTEEERGKGIFLLISKLKPCCNAVQSPIRVFCFYLFFFFVP